MEVHFFDWVRSTFPLERTLVFLAFGVIGMIGHYVTMWAKNRVDVCFVEYMFRQRPHRTALAFLGLVGTAFTHVITTDVTQVSWGMWISSAVGTGFAADSVLNSQNGDKGE